MKIVILIPTYQEKENLLKLIPELENQLKSSSQKAEILIVDDNSPDGSQLVVENFKRTFPNLHLLRGNKLGLGHAITRGLKYSLSKLEADLIVTMDSDFSHNPKDIKRLIIEIENGYDYVIGSRYIQGGKISTNWSKLRRLNSRWGNRVSRHIVGLKQVEDCTSGFRAIKAKVIEKADLDKIKEKGYVYQIRLLSEALKNGAKVKEVPIVFSERRSGKTKLGFSDILEFVISSVKLGIRRFK